jgi:hypothetical protein
MSVKASNSSRFSSNDLLVEFMRSLIIGGFYSEVSMEGGLNTDFGGNLCILPSKDNWRGFIISGIFRLWWLMKNRPKNQST